MALKVHKPKITLTSIGNGKYSAAMDAGDASFKAKPAEGVCWKIVAPAGFPGIVYVKFWAKDAAGNKVPAAGPFHSLQRLDGAVYKDNANKVVQMVPGGFLGPTKTTFSYSVWHDDAAGNDYELIDPEIVVDGDPNIPFAIKLRSIKGTLQKLLKGALKKAGKLKTRKTGRSKAAKTPKRKAKRR